MPRNVPPSNANSVGCKGITALGNDGQLYTSKKQSNGVYAWRLATKQVKSSKRKIAAPKRRAVRTINIVRPTRAMTVYQPQRQGVLLIRQYPQYITLSQAAQMRFLQEYNRRASANMDNARSSATNQIQSAQNATISRLYAGTKQTPIAKQRANALNYANTELKNWNNNPDPADAVGN